MFDALAFLPDLTQHIPRSACNSSAAADDPGYEPLSDRDAEVNVDARKPAWARLLAKVYEVDPMLCPKRGAEITVTAVIEDTGANHCETRTDCSQCLPGAIKWPRTVPISSLPHPIVDPLRIHRPD